MSKSSTFAAAADQYAADVQEFVAQARERLAELSEERDGIHTSAEVEDDETGIWSAFSGPVAVFGDVDRALAALASTARDVSDAALPVLSARDSDDDPKPAKKAAAKPAKKAASKKQAAKKSTAKKS